MKIPLLYRGKKIPFLYQKNPKAEQVQTLPCTLGITTATTILTEHK